MILLTIGLDNFIVNSCRQAFLKESRLPYFAIIILLALVLTVCIMIYRKNENELSLYKKALRLGAKHIANDHLNDFKKAGKVDSRETLSDYDIERVYGNLLRDARKGDNK